MTNTFQSKPVESLIPGDLISMLGGMVEVRNFPKRVTTWQGERIRVEVRTGSAKGATDYAPGTDVTVYDYVPEGH